MRGSGGDAIVGDGGITVGDFCGSGGSAVAGDGVTFDVVPDSGSGGAVAGDGVTFGAIPGSVPNILVIHSAPIIRKATDIIEISTKVLNLMSPIRRTNRAAITVTTYTLTIVQIIPAIFDIAYLTLIGYLSIAWCNNYMSVVCLSAIVKEISL